MHFVWFNAFCRSQQLWSWRDGQFTLQLFSWARLTKRLTCTSCTYFCLWLTATLLESAKGRRVAVENISLSIMTKVWDRAAIEPNGSVVRQVYAVRHYTDCTRHLRQTINCRYLCVFAISYWSFPAFFFHFITVSFLPLYGYSKLKCVQVSPLCTKF